MFILVFVTDVAQEVRLPVAVQSCQNFVCVAVQLHVGVDVLAPDVLFEVMDPYPVVTRH
jgi:hypothetical protein